MRNGIQVQDRSNPECLKVQSITDLVINPQEKGEETGFELFICSTESLFYSEVGD